VSAKPETVRKIRELVAEASAIDPNDVKAEGQLRGYGLDSARVIDLVVSIEEEFGVSVTEADLPTLHTVAELAEYVQQRLAGG